MTHFIRQQFLHVDLKGSESEGFALQQRLPELYYSKLLPAIEKALDKYSLKGRTLVIDRLDIDAGNILLEKIDQDLAALVTEALVSQIQQLTAKNNVVADSNELSALSLGHEEITWATFVYFLQNGFLPWSFRLPGDKNLEQMLAELIIEESQHQDKPLPVLQMAEVLKVSIFARRLVLQFSEPFIRLLMENISSGILTLSDSLFEDLGSISLPAEDLKLVKDLILEKSIVLASSGLSLSKEQIAKPVLAELRDKPGLFLKISNAFDNTWLEMKPDVNKVPDPNLKKAEEHFSAEVKAGIYIENSGLVLLHPFLQRFFEGLGIVKESMIIEPEKAIALLHFLSSGNTKTPEHELVLPKILCNLPILTPVPSEIEISVTETEEASALLDAVIKHWAALRSTSPDGLRSSFLLRPGKLSLKDDGDWLLQVETSTFDILLDQLPWGFSMVKLPWMEKMIWVEWR